jgi:Predicted outer membrane protein
MLYGETVLYAQLQKRTRIRRNLVAGVVACMLSVGIFTGCDKDDDDNNNNNNGVNNTDREFTVMASMSNYAEIQAGQLADNKAQNEGIDDFGEMMVEDHTNAGNQLKSIASELSLQVKDSLDAEHVLLMDTLQTVTGRAFDSVYIHSQVRDHHKAIALFQNEAQNGQNMKLKKFANDLLPKLQMHLHHADSLSKVY